VYPLTHEEEGERRGKEERVAEIESSKKLPPYHPISYLYTAYPECSVEDVRV